MLRLSQQYLPNIIIKSRPHFTHLNLRKTWKSNPPPSSQNSLHFELYTFYILYIILFPLDFFNVCDSLFWNLILGVNGIIFILKLFFIRIFNIYNKRVKEYDLRLGSYHDWGCHCRFAVKIINCDSKQIIVAG